MTGYWAANLKALRNHADPSVAALVAAVEPRGPAPDLGLRSREGRVLPGWQSQGRARSLVSTFDPRREAERWSESVEGGTVAVFGGAGGAALQALRQRGSQLVFWVEPDLAVWQNLLTWEDWSAETDHQDWIPVLGPPPAWEGLVKDRYHPVWDGGFRALEWRAATTGRESLWEDFRTATVRALEALAGDVSTQARFGERWYRNTLANLRRLRPAEVSPCTGAVAIAGAGPGLDDALDDPARRRWLEERPHTGNRLFSTDTALPALTARGVVPDLVLCLDGQLATYHHFVPARPAGVPLVADLASLPLLDRLGLPVVRYLSGHPLGAVVGRYFPELPVLDASLGNVSGLALRAAQALGATSVETWGVDFAYRDGQAYAHGTYVYDLAARNADRLAPTESRLAASCYGARGLERTRNAKGQAWDTTPLLRDYRLRWEAASPAPRPVTRLSHAGAGDRWEAFAEHWRRRLVTLPLPADARRVHAFVRALSPDRRQDWLALWPLALALHRRGAGAADLPEATRARALELLG